MSGSTTGRATPLQAGMVRAPGRILALLAAATSLLLLAGGSVLVGMVVVPADDMFGVGELLGWCALALLTGGLVPGVRTRPPILASGLVGSAALLGASPAAAATVAAAGALGGLLRVPGLALLRVLGAAALGWALPGMLAVAAGISGPMIGGASPIPLTAVLALWLALAVGVPLAGSLSSKLVLPPAEQIDPVHMIRHRLEPQTVLTALAVLAAMTYGAIGPLAALVVLLPAAAARVGFALHDEGRQAVGQTLATMTVLPEWAGIVRTGHTRRVRDVVEQATVDLGLESRLRRDIVRAAELHELGHLDGGVVGGDRGRIARSGAAVLRQAGMRQRVVQVLAATDPDRAVAEPDEEIELGAGLITLACAFDRQAPITAPAEVATRLRWSVSPGRPDDTGTFVGVGRP